MTDGILTLNAGSSSLKFAVFADDDLAPQGRGEVEALGGKAKLSYKAADGKRVERPANADEGGDRHEAALKLALATIRETNPDLRVTAIGHRIVHGGMHFTEPTRIDAAVEAALAELEPLAPLHQPHNLAGVRAARALFPDAPQIACFDTAFHSGRGFVAQAYGLPRAFYDEGVRRYGFHGLSYDYVSRRLREIAPEVAGGRVVIAHLGNGASLCGLGDGRSVATTMGFSTLDGLVMGSRPGQLDPGALLYLMSVKKLGVEALTDLLYKQSGLLGLSGLSNDWRELEGSDAPAAQEAIGCFVQRLRYELGGLAAALGGLDALVFTAGVGEHSASLRARVANGMDWLGLQLDAGANAAHATLISAPDSRVRVYVIPTDEERRIAELAAECLRAG